MSREENTIENGSDALAALQLEVSQLSDLFKRRLMEDRGKNALIETVQDQLRTANELLKYRDLEALIKEALLAIDRLQREPATPELVESAVDELLEVFRRRALVEIDDAGDFDPRVHEVVGTVDAAGELRPNTIAAIQRTGYRLGDRLLRPAQVTVAVAVSTDDRSA
ncbi:nucleotide exchange factor GrpE [Arthrobacter sp. B1I2]|uniref:nucleotide exchange factor GrpE n=1 Tax=Arthrobacter sp. B1I2 TaxID=3042263 RepID=UPI00277EED94|nr:nucleotide exchange factor GrpE [Arthrobacter sp. B1I2]MDQ0733196.1 molecular chaperone GrpE [Arthrobacter sp. B1I2]